MSTVDNETDKSSTTSLLWRVFCWISLPVLVLVAYPFAIPGILIAIVRRSNYPRFFASALALVIVIALRFITDEYTFRLGEGGDQYYLNELVCGAVSWAIGSLMMVLSYEAAIGAFGLKPQSKPLLRSSSVEA